MFIFSISLAYADESENFNKRLVDIENKTQYIKDNLDNNISVIEKISQSTLTTANTTIVTLGVMFGIIGLCGAIGTFIGIRSIRDIKKITKDAQNDLTIAQKEAQRTSFVIRAVHEIIYAEQLTNITIKTAKMRDAIKMLNLAKEVAGNSPSLSNWMGVAYKRLGEFDNACNAAMSAYNMSLSDINDQFENIRACYNIACYSALLNRPQDSIKYLEEVINRDKSYAVVARNDNDFNSIKHSQEFKDIVN
jgi:tetratricopeptide (TPR) repeat protein